MISSDLKKREGHSEQNHSTPSRVIIPCLPILSPIQTLMQRRNSKISLSTSGHPDDLKDYLPKEFMHYSGGLLSGNKYSPTTLTPWNVV